MIPSDPLDSRLREIENRLNASLPGHYKTDEWPWTTISDKTDTAEALVQARASASLDAWQAKETLKESLATYRAVRKKVRTR